MNKQKILNYKIDCPYCHRVMDVIPCNTSTTRKMHDDLYHRRSEEDKPTLIGSGVLRCPICLFEWDFIAEHDPAWEIKD